VPALTTNQRREEALRAAGGTDDAADRDGIVGTPPRHELEHGADVQTEGHRAVERLTCLA
jgi:hypothetical protein